MTCRFSEIPNAVIHHIPMLYEMTPTVQGLSHDRGWAKSAGNLGASDF
jgi:hypothetical protein